MPYAPSRPNHSKTTKKKTKANIRYDFFGIEGIDNQPPEKNISYKYSKACIMFLALKKTQAIKAKKKVILILATSR